ncbi:MAG: hypothetical protein HC811_11380 [Flammeovirgaceae bacterium]|nr:hypothetical protein [Flammeovirgaceae bacterium]
MVILIALLTFSCELIPGRVNPKSPPLPEPIKLEFTYQNSITLSGWVRFMNHSTGIEKFEWNFGFQDQDGKDVISNAGAPKIRFPYNGTYYVTLSGEAKNGNSLSIRELVIVNNY